MITRHQNELIARLEHVFDRGYSEIRSTELYRWYGRDRLTKNVWQDILEKWQIVTDDQEISLFYGKYDETFVFIYADGLSDSENSHFKNVKSLIGK